MYKFSLWSSNIWLLFVLPFVFMVGTGPLPFSVSGIQFDYIATFLLFFAIACSAWRANVRFSSRHFIVILYLVSLIPSVAFSQNIDLSLPRFAITSVYGILFIFLTVHEVDYKVYRALAVSCLGWIAAESIYVIWSFILNPLSSIRRFPLAGDIAFHPNNGDTTGVLVDPNMPAMGLVLLLLFCIPFIHLESYKLPVRFLSLLFIILLLLALLILQSRTAFVAFVMAAFLFLACTPKVRLNHFFYILFFGIAVFSLSFLDLQDGQTGLASRFDLHSIVAIESSETGRISLVSNVFQDFSSSPKNILIGLGYSVTNPHNEYFRNFFDSGILAGFIHLFLLVYVYINARIKLKLVLGHTLYVDAIALPFFFMLATYGHTKTFWVGLAFVSLVASVRYPHCLILTRRWHQSASGTSLGSSTMTLPD